MAKIKNIKESTLDAEFVRVYEENFDRLFFFALKYTKSEELAKDVVSDVFLNLWKSRDRFSEIRQLESYLYISVKNEAIHVLSKNFNHSSLDAEKEIKSIDQVDPQELLQEKELLKEIDRTVEQLPDQCRLIFDMAKNRQMKYKEIAEELGVSVSTVRMQLIKATSAIKDSIRKKYDDDNHTGHIQLGMVSLMLISLVGI